MVQTAANVPSQTVRAVTPGKKQESAMDPVELQQTLLRFAAEYSTRMVLSAEKLRRGTNDEDPTEILKWKVALTTEICSIASGPNTVANLLDMTAFVTVVRMALENYWRPKVFGESALPMLENSRNAESEIWQLTGKLLTADQQKELRQAIELWQSRNPMPETVVAARALGSTLKIVEPDSTGASRPGSLFSMLRVDPLAGMDPAVRELAQTRLFAERALFVTQQMPILLRWHIELLSLNAMEMPAARQLVANSAQIASSVERFSHAAEQLPGQISTERVEILKSLEAQEKQLTPMVSEVRQTLAAGTEMSTSLNTTLKTFDALMERFGVGETNGAGSPETNTEPFRILDYRETAAQVEATSRQLTELLNTLDRTVGSTNLAQLSTQAQIGGRELVDYAFWKGILLVAIVLIAALIYRFVVMRLMSTRGSRPNVQ